MKWGLWRLGGLIAMAAALYVLFARGDLKGFAILTGLSFAAELRADVDDLKRREAERTKKEEALWNT
jgi:NaMN:DMB phosphoribosyltransferase